MRRRLVIETYGGDCDTPTGEGKPAFCAVPFLAVRNVQHGQFPLLSKTYYRDDIRLKNNPSIRVRLHRARVSGTLF